MFDLLTYMHPAVQAMYLRDIRASAALVGRPISLNTCASGAVLQAYLAAPFYQVSASFLLPSLGGHGHSTGRGNSIRKKVPGSSQHIFSHKDIANAGYFVPQTFVQRCNFKILWIVFSWKIVILLDFY